MGQSYFQNSCFILIKSFSFKGTRESYDFLEFMALAEILHMQTDTHTKCCFWGPERIGGQDDGGFKKCWLNPLRKNASSCLAETSLWQVAFLSSESSCPFPGWESKQNWTPDTEELILEAC